jgi:dihydroxyacetone kinase-like predicted kinase
MNNTNTTKEDISSLLSELADDLVCLMIREHQYIHEELEHVRNLVSDATRSLTSSFDEMNILAIEQTTMVTLALQLNNANNKELLEQCKRSEKHYRSNQVRVVTALQFDDIVQQLAKHAQDRSWLIQEMFKRLERAINEFKLLQRKDDPDFIRKIHDLKRDALNLRSKLEEENPVKQLNLAIGKTELF